MKSSNPKWPAHFEFFSLVVLLESNQTNSTIDRSEFAWLAHQVWCARWSGCAACGPCSLRSSNPFRAFYGHLVALGSGKVLVCCWKKLWRKTVSYADFLVGSLIQWKQEDQNGHRSHLHHKTLSFSELSMFHHMFHHMFIHVSWCYNLTFSEPGTQLGLSLPCSFLQAFVMILLVMLRGDILRADWMYYDMFLDTFWKWL